MVGVFPKRCAEAARVLESKGLLTRTWTKRADRQPSNDWNCMDPSVIRWELNGPDGLVFGTHLMALLAQPGRRRARLAAANASEDSCPRSPTLSARYLGRSAIGGPAVTRRAGRRVPPDLLRAANNPGVERADAGNRRDRTCDARLSSTRRSVPGQISGRIAVVTAIRSGDGGAAEQAMLSLNSLVTSAGAHETRPQPVRALLSASEDGQPVASRRPRLTVVPSKWSIR